MIRVVVVIRFALSLLQGENASRRLFCTHAILGKEPLSGAIINPKTLKQHSVLLCDTYSMVLCTEVCSKVSKGQALNRDPREPGS